MGEQTTKPYVIARFGEEIARIHQRHLERVKRELKNITDPQTDHARAIAGYYAGMSQEQVITSFVSRGIEGALHDLFFLFDENEDFNLTLVDEAGSTIDLAKTLDVIQAFPMTWIAARSASGYEGDRILEYLNRLPGYNETKQQRRGRILDQKNKPRSKDD